MHLLNTNLTEKQIKIMMLLFLYRGMTAKDLAIFTSCTLDFTLSLEKSIYNILATLKKKGLVVSHKLQQSIGQGSIYYLTKNGLDIIKNILDIGIKQNGNGWLPEQNFTSFWDIPYEAYTPPLKQLAHHLLNIQFLAHLITDSKFEYLHRTNLYSAREYVYIGKKCRLRPDMEVWLNEQLYSIEIDRSSESHEQLILKFETYKQYIEHCKKEGFDQKAIIKNIIFVVESKSRVQGMKRRWNNVYAAYLKVFGNDNSIKLIMTSIDRVQSTLAFEKNREAIEEKQLEALKTEEKKHGYTFQTSFVVADHQQLLIAKFNSEESYRFNFFVTTHEFSSELLNKYAIFKYAFQNRNLSNGLKTEDENKKVYVQKSAITTVNNLPTINLKHYEIDKKIVELYEEMMEDLDVIPY